MTLITSMLLYFALAIVLPFVISFIGPSTCSPMDSLIVYGAYCGFVAVSTLAECGILVSLRSVLRTDTGAGSLSCNRYLYAKWWQGQLANLDTFVHVGFVASALRCFIIQESNHSKEASQNVGSGSKKGSG